MKLINLILLPIFFLCSFANSFELKTHLYIGEQVLSDLSDGKLTIYPFGEFDVDPELTSLILENKKYFLIGNMGPDVVPDFLGGQVTTHPGLSQGWNTDDWLKILSVPVYNSYDVTTIPSVQPPPWDSENDGGESIPNLNECYYCNVWPLPGSLQILKTTPDFEKTSFPSPSWDAFYRGYLGHAASDVFAHTYVNMYAGDVFDLTDVDALQVELRHKLLEMYIAKHQPGTVDTSWKNSLRVGVIKQKLLSNQAVADQYKLSGSAVYLYYMHQYEQEVDKLAEPIGILKRSIKAVIQKYADRQAFYEQLIGQYDSGNGETSEEVSRQQKIVDDLTPLANFAVCEFIFSGFEAQSKAESLRQCRWKREVDAYILDLALAEDRLKNLKNQAKDFYGDNPELAEWADELGVGRPSRSEAAEALVLIAAAIVFGEELDLRAIALDIAVTQYRRYIVKKAGEEYIKANIETAANVVEQKNISTTLRPITDWLACYGPVYTLEIGSVAPVICEVKDGLENLSARLKDTLKETVDNEEILDLYYAYQQVQEDIRQLAISLGKKIVAGVLPDEQKEFIGWVTNPVSDASLRAAFMQDGNQTRVLKISDIADRIKGDMDLGPDGTFNPLTFAPIFNAIQLSKMALLDDTEINRLERLAGVAMNDYRPYYYHGKFNILFSWIKSIDGNHQWMPSSPKLPRQAGFDDPRSISDRDFSVGNGLLLWEGNNNRDLLFKKLFKGPVALGLESSETIGLSNFLPSYYENRNCFSDPFPETSGEFETCLPLSAWLIPILNILN